MKTLSKLIRDVAEPGFWREELQRTAEDSGYTSGQRVQAAWDTVSEVLDSILVLAFEYRHHDADFGPALQEWCGFLRQGLDPEDSLESTILWQLLHRIESTFAQFESDRQKTETLRQTRPQKLDASNALYAREVAAHLKKAAAKVRRIEKTSEVGKFEMEVYRSILESAIRHFDEMGETSPPAYIQEAA